MNEVSGKVDSGWLQAVLQTLTRTSVAGNDDLGALRDQLVSLAWDERAPRASVFQAIDAEERFRRHPLASIESIGCSALLMYWPPGHATLPHDHGGLWGIEVVIDGSLAINEFVRQSDKADAKLAETTTLHLGVGDAALFESARYIHRCRNLSNVHPTLTLHVYGGALNAFNTFSHDQAGACLTQLVTPHTDALLS